MTLEPYVTSYVDPIRDRQSPDFQSNLRCFLDLIMVVHLATNTF